MIYDTIVIGMGLIGVAAAKYLGQMSQNVALLGPDEERALKEGVVFSSHYDQSRIQRIIGKDETWTLLNQQSANEYSALEKASNIYFHSGVGCLYVNPYGRDAYLDHADTQAKSFNLNYLPLQSAELIHSSFPDYHFPSSSSGILESSPSGHINPRLLITAQLKIFEKNGGKIYNETVNDLIYEKDHVKISTLGGQVFLSKKVLLAPGAFINSFHLLKQKLDLTLKSETTILAKVSAEEARRLEKLPSLLYEIMDPAIQNIYLVRPVQYPDGNFYIKMGANLPGDLFFDDLAGIQAWFTGKNNDEDLATMQRALMTIIPSLSIESCAIKKCIVTFTKHHKPYIGTACKGLYFATGGNGYSAMCSDALGRIAATLTLTDEFPREFSQKDFEPVFKT